RRTPQDRHSTDGWIPPAEVCTPVETGSLTTLARWSMKSAANKETDRTGGIDGRTEDSSILPGTGCRRAWRRDLIGQLREDPSVCSGTTDRLCLSWWRPPRSTTLQR